MSAPITVLAHSFRTGCITKWCISGGPTKANPCDIPGLRYIPYANFLKCRPYEQVWAGPLTGYRIALLLVNRGPDRHNITAHWDDIGLDLKASMEVRDLWEV